MPSRLPLGANLQIPVAYFRPSHRPLIPGRNPVPYRQGVIGITAIGHQARNPVFQNLFIVERSRLIFGHGTYPRNGQQRVAMFAGSGAT